MAKTPAAANVAPAVASTATASVIIEDGSDTTVLTQTNKAADPAKVTVTEDTHGNKIESA